MCRTTNNHKFIALALLHTGILLLTLSVNAVGQTRSGGGEPQRVQLNARRPCVILRGTVQPPQRHSYIFRANKGQLIVTDVFYHGSTIKRRGDDEEGSSDFIFVYPDGRRVEDAQDVVFPAAKAGEYRVIVRPTRRRTSSRYTLKISLHPSNWTDTGDFDAASRQRCP